MGKRTETRSSTEGSLGWRSESDIPVLSLRVGVLRAHEEKQRRGEGRSERREISSGLYSTALVKISHRQSTVIALLGVSLLPLSRLVTRASADVSAFKETLKGNSTLGIAGGASEPPFGGWLSADAAGESSTPVVGDDTGA